MPVRTNLWKVGSAPQQLAETKLPSEQYLEEMIVSDSRMLSYDWMLIGRQEHTEFGGIIDLLAIAPDGSLVLIELKRDRTPRDVVAQALDYASWIERIESSDLTRIYDRFAPGKNLANSFQSQFGRQLDEDEINQSHQIIIVAAELDSSTERIVAYLNDRHVPINVLCFQVFTNGDDQFLSRTWLLDPIETQTAASTTKKRDAEPWNGEFYCSFGHGEARVWGDAVKHGFVCGGGGAWYSRTMQLLNPGDRIWVKVPGEGFVGVGKVLSRALSASEFQLPTSNGVKPVLDVLTDASYHREYADDDDKAEHFVAVEWLETKAIEDAVQEVGMFGNQNTVCKPTTQKWRTTVDRLKAFFDKFDK